MPRRIIQVFIYHYQVLNNLY